MEPLWRESSSASFGTKVAPCLSGQIQVLWTQLLDSVCSKVLQYDSGSEFYELSYWILDLVAKCSNILQDIYLIFLHQTLLPTNHFVSLIFLVNLQFSQFAISLTCHFVNLPLPMYKLVIHLSYHFVNLVFCQLFILSTCYFVNLAFYQLGILSTRHSFTIQFHPLANLLLTWHFVNLTFYQLGIVKLTFCQMAILSTWHFELANLPTCHLLTCPFVNLAFLLCAILSDSKKSQHTNLQVHKMPS